MKFYILPYLFLSFFFLSAADSIPPEVFTPKDSLTDSLSTSEASDTSLPVISDTIQSDTLNLDTSLSNSLPLPGELADKPSKVNDSITVLSGILWGFGSGFSLGDLPLFSLWKSSLPDSLNDFGIDKKSFVTLPDTSVDDSLQFADTSVLVYEIKEHPSIYNMTFPIRLSITGFHRKNIFKTSLAYSLTYKNHKSIIYSADDTLGRRIDIKHKLFLHSLSAEFMYGREIPSRYFSIESIEKSYFLVGLGISPLLHIKTSRDTKNNSSDNRMSQVNNSIVSCAKDIKSFGTSFTFKTGISAIRRISTNSIAEIGLFYSFNWFDYFYNNGHRLIKSDINTTGNDRSNLSFISNRFEIGVNLYRKAK